MFKEFVLGDDHWNKLKETDQQKMKFDKQKTKTKLPTKTEDLN